MRPRGVVAPASGARSAIGRARRSGSAGSWATKPRTAEKGTTSASGASTERTAAGWPSAGRTARRIASARRSRLPRARSTPKRATAPIVRACWPSHHPASWATTMVVERRLPWLGGARVRSRSSMEGSPMSKAARLRPSAIGWGARSAPTRAPSLPGRAPGAGGGRGRPEARRRVGRARRRPRRRPRRPSASNSSCWPTPPARSTMTRSRSSGGATPTRSPTRRCSTRSRAAGGAGSL